MIPRIGHERQPRTEDAWRVYEYFRLMALMEKVLGTGSKSPFFDVAKALKPDIEEIDPSILLGQESFPTLGPLARLVCLWHLRFESLPEDLRSRLPISGSPYQPLIDLLASGGRFGREDVFVELGQMSIPWTRWRDLGD